MIGSGFNLASCAMGCRTRPCSCHCTTPASHWPPATKTTPPMTSVVSRLANTRRVLPDLRSKMAADAADSATPRTSLRCPTRPNRHNSNSGSCSVWIRFGGNIIVSGQLKYGIWQKSTQSDPGLDHSSRTCLSATQSSQITVYPCAYPKVYFCRTSRKAYLITDPKA